MTTGVIRRRIWEGPGIPSAFLAKTILEAEAGAIARDFQNPPIWRGSSAVSQKAMLLRICQKRTSCRE